MDVLGKNFSLCTFNCHGLKSSLQYVLDLCKSHDIIIVNEHWLQHSDFYTISDIFKSNGMSIYLKSSMDPTECFRGRPFGGVGFVCANLENVSYKLIECVSDRILGLEVIINQTVVLTLLGVYLHVPHDDCTSDRTELYVETLCQMQHLIDTLKCNVPLVILGDMNTALPAVEFLADRWHCKTPYSKHSALLYDFISYNHMCVADFMFPQSVSYTYKHGNKCSYIDHILITNYMCEDVIKCDILDHDMDNVSDHLAVSLSLAVSVPQQNVKNVSLDKVKAFPKPNWEESEFQHKYLECMKIAMDKIPLISIDEISQDMVNDYVDSLYDSICQAIHDCVENIVLRRESHPKTKRWWTKECKAARDRNRLYYYI